LNTDQVIRFGIWRVSWRLPCPSGVAIVAYIPLRGILDKCLSPAMIDIVERNTKFWTDCLNVSHRGARGVA
jgi:hypothetical protein